MSPGPRIGIFGGSFDPIHLGHLVMAQEAVHRLGLERLLFLPARRAAHKRARAVTPVEHRLAMLRLAARGNPRLGVSRLEADQKGVSFTVHTLATLARRTRGQLYFLMGQDSLEAFHTWRDPERIARLARLVVVPRGTGKVRALDPQLQRKVVVLRSPLIAISSSEIRARLRRGAPVRYWVPDGVLRYVQRHGLYGKRPRR